MRARREVWRRREPELCRPGHRGDASGPLTPPGPRPCPLPHGPIEGYRGRLGPTALGAALGLLPLTFAPSRSADLLKALTPEGRRPGPGGLRRAFWTCGMCGRGVLPMDGSAYRRLDRVDAVVVDGAALCTGPPVVVEVASNRAAEAAGWDAAALDRGVAAARVRRSSGETPGRLRLGPAGPTPTRPGGRVHALRDADGERIGTAVVTDELDPHAEALLRAVGEAGTGSCSPRTPAPARRRGPRRRGRRRPTRPCWRPSGACRPTGPRGAGRLGASTCRAATARAGAATPARAARRGRRGRPGPFAGRAPAVGRRPGHRAGPRRRLPDRRRHRRRAHGQPPVRRRRR